MFGSGGVSHRTSRLYLNLVDEGLAVGVGGSLSASIDSSTFSLYLTKHPDHTVEEILQALDRQIEAIQSEPISQAEVDRALKQTKALLLIAATTSPTRLLDGYASSFADYSWFTHYVESISAITPDMVHKIAQKYLRSDARVIGVYTPNQMRIKMPKKLFSTAKLPGPDDTLRQVFPNGSVLLARSNPTSPAIAIGA